MIPVAVATARALSAALRARKAAMSADALGAAPGTIVAPQFAVDPAILQQLLRGLAPSKGTEDRALPPARAAGAPQ
jgi:hypothetical protein